MAGDYDPRNSLIFFENDRRRDGINPKTGKPFNDPELTGTYTDAEGNEHWLSIWPKTNKKDGSTFWTGSTRPKEARDDAPRSRPAPARAGSLSMRRAPVRDQDSDDIP